MSRAVTCLFLFFIGTSAMDAINNTDSDFEHDNLQTLQKFEESARRQWELSSRKKPTTDLDETEHSETLSSETVELFTWFPWFNNGPAIHTIKAIATLKKENDSKLPAALGVGSWHEITLFGKRKEINSVEEPDASALSRSLTINVSNELKWFTAIVSCFMFIRHIENM